MMKVEARDKLPHPLKNPDSTHYEMFDGLESIDILEKIMTTTELKAWARGSIYKYLFRMGKKKTDTSVSDMKKIQTYENYYRYLENKDD